MIVTHVSKSHTAYIGRGQCPKRDGCINLNLGNPFSIGRHGTREEVIQRFRLWFVEQVNTNAEFKARVLSAKHETVACYCKPQACHGDVIKEYLDDDG